MRRRELLTVAGGAALLWPLAAAGQQPKMPVVGILVAGRPDPTPMLRTGLRQAQGDPAPHRRSHPR